MFEALCLAGLFLFSRKAVLALTEDFAIAQIISVNETPEGFISIYTDQGLFFTRSAKFLHLLRPHTTVKIVYQGFSDRNIVSVEPINIESKSQSEPVAVGSN